MQPPRVPLALALVVITACSDIVTATTGDAGPTDASRPDVVDPPVDLCGARTIDANATGNAHGRVTTVSFDPSQLERGAPLPPSSGCGAPIGTTHRLVLRYTPRADAFLRVQRVFTGVSSLRVDRIVVLDGCGASAHRLACSGALESYPLDGASEAVTRERVRAGVPLTIAVALDEIAGAIDLVELPDTLPVGAPCDAAGRANLCAPGSTCSSAIGRCVPDGATFGACRREGAPCDAGMRCVDGTADGPPGRCVPVVAIGGDCLFSAQCAEGVCVPGPVNGRCAPAGARLQPCRKRGPSCDEGLVCAAVDAGSQRLCVPALPSGAACRAASDGSAWRPEPWCREGESCVAVQESLPRCIRDGAEGGLCRRPGDGCDAGLACDTSRCVRPGVEGAPCDPSRRGDCGLLTACVMNADGHAGCRRFGTPGAPCRGGACDAGYACVAERCVPRVSVGERCSTGAPSCVEGASCRAMSGAGDRCVADGTLDGRCRRVAPPCDAGLACDFGGLCRPMVALGAACGDLPASDGCVSGARCEDTCRLDGSDGGWCRPASPACDGGLVCAPLQFGRVPVCVRALHAGDRCDGTRSDHETQLGECTDGTACVTDPDRRERHCAPLGPPPCILSDPTACPTGTRCTAGECHPVLPSGSACTPETPCEGDERCEGFPSRCGGYGAREGACRPDGGCDPGLRCATVSSGSATRRVCLEARAVGAACDDHASPQCAEGSWCVRGTCTRDGVEGARCRDAATPCDAGLSCVLGFCRRASAAGEMCILGGAPRCVAGLECRFVDDDARCLAPSYDIEVREGVAFEDPCDVPLAPLSTPLSFTFARTTYETELSPEGFFNLRAVGLGRPEGRFLVSLWGPDTHDLALWLPNPGCARVLGTAPTRRLVLGGGLWARGAENISHAEWEVLLYEGTNVVELRYAAPPPDGRAYAVPWLRGWLASIDAPAVRVTAGTSVRFVPR